MRLFTSKLGWLRVLSVLEGFSLIILVFIGVPLKRIWESPELVQILGPIHGAFFLLFCMNLLGAAVEYRWKWTLSAKLFLASMIPFGTIFLDYKVLKPMWESEVSEENPAE
ncbi:DUF3817 domain-containing protein [Leptospira wolffii]|uniref:DUF3817 domain-containing protein n=1 Tax=Leptospira wolffii TaxID=409998 RepID=A0ABV5BNN3_9LEPT|nr:DUF3817 domain-containing protein [Leptospira wolffii]EPG65861.1 putative membrane protein [Leptospira wolffii serovar Khorat str. Khorat-H2]TGL47345.1 DUF3817 domain-containing protein [Leptospira wolffii]